AAFVLVAVRASDPLVAARAERPAAVLRRRSVAGQQHAPDIGGLPRVVQSCAQFVDGVRAECVAHLRPIERDPHRSLIHRSVIGDVGEIEPLNAVPGGWIEKLGDHAGSAYGSQTAPTVGVLARLSPGNRTTADWEKRLTVTALLARANIDAITLF